MVYCDGVTQMRRLASAGGRAACHNLPKFDICYVASTPENEMYYLSRIEVTCG